jgi:hypothetical protein
MGAGAGAEALRALIADVHAGYVEARAVEAASEAGRIDGPAPSSLGRRACGVSVREKHGRV